MSKTDSSDVQGQAPDELARNKLWGVTAASIAVTGVAVAISWLLLARWGGPTRSGPPPEAPKTIGILEQTLIRDTERGVALRREQAASLRRWAWIDRDAGIAQIPVESAIDVLAASPLPPDRPLEEPDTRRTKGRP